MNRTTSPNWGLIEHAGRGSLTWKQDRARRIDIALRELMDFLTDQENADILPEHFRPGGPHYHALVMLQHERMRNKVQRR